MKTVRLSLQKSGGKLPSGLVDFSPLDMYATTRAIERAATGQASALTDSGCEPDDCITAIGQWGVVPLQQLVSDGRYDDIDTTNVNNEPSTDLEQRAATMLLPGAYDVDITASDASTQVQALNTAGVGQNMALFVDSALENWDFTKGPITSIDLSDPNGGGHQVGITYYRNDSKLGLVIGFGNSWGNWGISGFGEVTWACLKKGALDAIVAVDVSIATKEAA